MVEERAKRVPVVEERASRSHLLTATSGRIKAARRLADRRTRRELGRFLIEGPLLLTEAYAASGVLEEVYATPAAADRYAALRDSSPVPWQLADDRALASLSDTVTPTGLVAVCHTIERKLDQAVSQDARLVAVCADVRDPGNAGTVIRCADAAGVDAVVFAGDCVDALNPKTVRATVGSLFHLPIARTGDVPGTVDMLRRDGFTVLAADGGGEVDLFEADDLLTGKTAWLFGNEAWGLPEETAALADHRIRIPIFGAAESLNLSTAAAICLYASARVAARSCPGRDARTASARLPRRR